MKNLIIIIAIFQLFSCSKENINSISLVGEWKWHSTSGVWSNSTSANSDTQWRLVFTSSNIESKREGDINLLQSSAYYIVERYNGSNDEPYNYIVTEKILDNLGGNAFHLSGDSLIFFNYTIFHGDTHLFLKSR